MLCRARAHKVQRLGVSVMQQGRKHNIDSIKGADYGLENNLIHLTHMTHTGYMQASLRDW